MSTDAGFGNHMAAVVLLVCILGSGCSGDDTGDGSDVAADDPAGQDGTTQNGATGTDGSGSGSIDPGGSTAGSSDPMTGGAQDEPMDSTGSGSVSPGVDAGLAGGGDAGFDDGVQADAGLVVATGILPVPDALDQDGPYAVLDEPDTGPGNQFRLFAPQPLGEDGLKHPIVAWSPGAGAFPDAYITMLTRLATHGFVTLSYNTTANGQNLVDAIDWLLAENERTDSVLYGKLDPTRIAAGGHSAGSLATYQMADDPRLVTTLHMSGGSFNPTTDVPKLRNPALMVCGDAGGDGLVTGDIANPMCATDFEMAQVPVFYAVVTDGGHTALNEAEATLGIGTAADDPKKLLFIKAMVGWLRWQLADDQSMKTLFVGADCELCAADSGYTVMQKDLN